MKDGFNMKMIVNGDSVEVSLANPMRRLLDVLREDLGLTGVKEGCGEGECGACSVLMDGKLVNSCLVPAAQADGCEIVTIEGLTAEDEGRVIAESFVEEGGIQCGFCTPGMIMASAALLRVNMTPDKMEIRTALSGNICRCTGYDKIVDSVQAASGTLSGRDASDSAGKTGGQD